MGASLFKQNPPNTSNTPSKQVLWKNLWINRLDFKIWQEIEAKIEELSFFLSSLLVGKEEEKNKEFWVNFLF